MKKRPSDLSISELKIAGVAAAAKAYDLALKHNATYPNIEISYVTFANESDILNQKPKKNTKIGLAS